MNWPRIAVGAVVLRGNEILLVKRKYPPAPNRWSIPGGHVEPGEELEVAVIRELREETGLIGSNPKLLAITEYIAYEANSIKYHYVIIDYLIKNFEGELRPNEDEVLDASFFNLEEALNLKLTRTTRKLIELILGKGVSEVHHIVYREFIRC